MAKIQNKKTSKEYEVDSKGLNRIMSNPETKELYDIIDAGPTIKVETPNEVKGSEKVDKKG
jgi:hypothetical protein